MRKGKNLRRISILVTAQTAGNLQRLADMEQIPPGRVMDKLVRDRMVALRMGGQWKGERLWS